MKFEIGQIVKHKLNSEKVVIVRIERNIFNKYRNRYICSIGKKGSEIVNTDSSDYVYFYEAELESVRDVKGGISE